MQLVTLRVTSAPRRLHKRTQSATHGMPMQSIGMIGSWLCVYCYNSLSSVIGNSRIRLPVA